jgi:hypothetical protein
MVRNVIHHLTQSTCYYGSTNFSKPRCNAHSGDLELESTGRVPPGKLDIYLKARNLLLHGVDINSTSHNTVNHLSSSFRFISPNRPRLLLKFSPTSQSFITFLAFCKALEKNNTYQTNIAPANVSARHYEELCLVHRPEDHISRTASDWKDNR